MYYDVINFSFNHYNVSKPTTKLVNHLYVVAYSIVRFTYVYFTCEMRFGIQIKTLLFVIESQIKVALKFYGNMNHPVRKIIVCLHNDKRRYNLVSCTMADDFLLHFCMLFCCCCCSWINMKWRLNKIIILSLFLSKWT